MNTADSRTAQSKATDWKRETSLVSQALSWLAARSAPGEVLDRADPPGGLGSPRDDSVKFRRGIVLAAALARIRELLLVGVCKDRITPGPPHGLYEESAIACTHALSLLLELVLPW